MFIGGLILVNSAFNYMAYKKSIDIQKEIKQNQTTAQSIKQDLMSLPMQKYFKEGLEKILDQKYDSNDFLMNNPIYNTGRDMDFSKVSSSRYILRIKGEYESEDKDTLNCGKYSKMLALKDKNSEVYFLTLNHIVALEKEITKERKIIKDQKEKKIKTKYVLKKISYSIMIDEKNGKEYSQKCDLDAFSYFGLNKIIDDQELDFALLHLPKENIPKNINFNFFPYAIGKKSELDQGNKLYLIGNAFNHGTNLRGGIVSMKNAPISIRPKNHKKYFTMSIPASPGDSGGLILALRDGNIELMGLMACVHKKNSCISYAVGIDAIMEKIKNGDVPDLYESMQDRMFRGY